MEKLSSFNSTLVSRPAPSFEIVRNRSNTQGFERFRKAASLVAVAGIAALLFWSEPSHEPALRATETILGFLFTAIAVFGRLWCAVYIAGRKNAELCALGPYSLCRNPLYAFSSLGVAGIVLTTQHAVLAVAAFILFWLYHHSVIRSEETRLTALFGQAFVDYCERVPSVWPCFSAYSDIPSLTVNTRPLLRAFLEVGWFFVVWLAAHLVFTGV